MLKIPQLHQIPPTYRKWQIPHGLLAVELPTTIKIVHVCRISINNRVLAGLEKNRKNHVQESQD